MMADGAPDRSTGGWTRGRKILVFVAAVAVLALIAALLAWRPGDDDSAQTAAQASTSSSLAALQKVTTQATDVRAAPQETGGEPFKTCAVCHNDFMDKPGTQGDLIFSHQTHLDQQVPCETCHPLPLAHFGQPAPMMTTCLNCHQGKTAPNDCKLCHRKVDQIAPGLGEVQVHLKPDAKTRKTCEKCHDVDVWCEKCHGVQMPHPAVWDNAHGAVALEDPEVCVKCHQSKDKTFCVGCHGVEMPHPAYWYTEHGPAAKTNGSTCVRCHTEGSQFCNSCHHAGYDPTPQWNESQHGQAVASKGDTGCFNCHAQSFCEQCHPVGAYTR